MSAIWKSSLGPLLFAGLSLSGGSVSLPDDPEIVLGHFRSENNFIEEIHFETSAAKPFLILKLKNRLTAKNSRARQVEDKRSNYGDSASKFAYLEINKENQAIPEALAHAHREQLAIDLIYSCGDQPDDRKRKLFPFYVETNCEAEALTLKLPKEKRGYW
jgi:hypothetical protein